MSDMSGAIKNTISISVFNRGLAGKIFEDVKKTGTKVVMKNNVAECVLMSPDEYVELMEELNDLRLLRLAEERLNNMKDSDIISEEEALKELGIRKEDIEPISEDLLK